MYLFRQKQTRDIFWCKVKYLLIHIFIKTSGVTGVDRVSPSPSPKFLLAERETEERKGSYKRKVDTGRKKIEYGRGKPFLKAMIFLTRLIFL